jgi:UDP-N-acetylglucosamine diphosphorylase / glucose-1-phosphate thymidylyltransferase / UDP-N-acetylgalactosamine diphosphorylase / glucosamine-1-phosphate N-acetyltransferase / galactosamine-1-phosphate N-acetyltransferase
MGPGCRIGGEVANSIIHAYSNKGHDGYLGNSVLGSWVNLGANTTVSNLKNTYSNPKIYDYATQSPQDCGGLFCGLIAGDHVKTGIQTMLNTGTVLGVMSNVFGAGFPPKFMPSFSWGHANEVFALDKALELAHKVMARRKQSPTPADIELLSWVFHNRANIGEQVGNP